MFADFRHAVRSLARSPGFTAAAVLVLALGLGANTAIFSVVEATLLRPLPFPHADRLVRLYEAFDEPDTRANTLNLSELTFRQWREQGGEVFEDVAAASAGSLTLGELRGEPARYLPAARITANFFTTLGLPPALGRTFTADEDRPAGARVAIISHDLWQREFGGRADVLGATLILDNAPHTVVGVMPPNFRHPYRAEVWLPLAAAFDAAAARGRFLYCVARLKPSLTRAQADAAMRRVCAAVNQTAPDPQNPRRAYVVPIRENFVADLQPKLLTIAGAALCALLVAAANFAGLLLARTVAREGEIAVRAALGASRGRLVRETLAQALVLATLGALAGLLFAAWLTPALVALSPEGSDGTASAMREFDYAVRLDWPVFGFATVATLFVGVGFGLLPAWRSARADLRAMMNNGGRSATLDRGTRRLLGALVVGEIAAAAVLLVAGAMLTQYYRHLLNEPWGFATEHRLTFQTTFSDRLFADTATRTAAVDRIVTELRATPGVRAATATLPHPMSPARQLITNNPDGLPPPEPRGFHLAYLRATLPGYYAALGQRLVRGRDFTGTDTATSLPVCLVSESYARHFWPGEDPVGRRVKWGRLDGARPWFTVVGVVADTKVIVDPNDGLVEGVIILPLARVFATNLVQFEEVTFELEGAGDPRLLEPAVRAALARADARLAAYDIISLEDKATETRATERFALVLVSLFGVLGLVLAAIGLYGLLALQVSRRTREFGVRTALGATATQIIRLVVGQGARLFAAGLLLGGGGAWVAVRLAHARWPAIPTADPLPFLAAMLVLALATTLACWLPARRAGRVDPMTALRAE